jgi:hypothetical protein
MSTYFFPKEIADYTLFNLIPVLEELWNHSRYQDNEIFKEYVKIFFPNKQNLGKASKRNSNTHYLKNSQTIFYQINGIWVKDSKRISRIHII